MIKGLFTKVWATYHEILREVIVVTSGFCDHPRSDRLREGAVSQEKWNLEAERAGAM